MTTQRPAAAVGVSQGAIPVAHGSSNPAAASISDTAVTRTTGIGNSATPVWPVAIIRSLLMVLLAIPDPRNTRARVP
jgi:hypothetical protein